MPLIPVRCFTCGKVIADGKWSIYQQRVDEGESAHAVLDDLKLTRMCCRRMYLTHVDLIDDMLKYPTEGDGTFVRVEKMVDGKYMEGYTRGGYIDRRRQNVRLE